MAVAKMTGAGGGKKKAAGAKAGSKVGKAVKPNMQKKLVAKKQAAAGMKPTATAQGRKVKQVHKPMLTGGQINSSWANNMGEGVIGFGGMRFDPTTNSKAPVYGGLPRLVGHVDPMSIATTGQGKGAAGNLYSATLPSGQTITGTLELLSYLLPGMDKVGLRALPAGSGTYRDYWTQAANHAADPARFAPAGRSDHQYGNAIDFTKSAMNPKLRGRLFDLFARMGMNQQAGENWHWAVPNTDFTS